MRSGDPSHVCRECDEGPLCPDTSGVHLLGDCECVIDLDPEVTDSLSNQGIRPGDWFDQDCLRHHSFPPTDDCADGSAAGALRSGPKRVRTLPTVKPRIIKRRPLIRVVAIEMAIFPRVEDKRLPFQVMDMIAGDFANEDLMIAPVVDGIGAALKVDDRTGRQGRPVSSVPDIEPGPFVAAGPRKAVGYRYLLFVQNGDRESRRGLPFVDAERRSR